MSKAANIPYDWPEIEAQVRNTIIAMASILQNFGPRDNQATVDAFLGTHVETVGRYWMSTEEFEGIDITRHGLYEHTRAAWCYAYQLDGWESFTIEHYHEIACGLLHGGYALTDSENEPTGLDSINDMPLRRVLETACARRLLGDDDAGLTVRQLALLSNMAEATVRSSLSKEGFRMGAPDDNEEDKFSSLPSHDARLWLSRRRGFIPNAAGSAPDRHHVAMRDTLADLSIPFPTAVKRIAELAGGSKIIEARIDPQWYAALVEGRAVAIDVAALVALADTFEVPRADFAARGVRHLLELESN